TRKYNSFEEWAEAQPQPPVREPPPPDMPIIDPVTQWRLVGEERERQRTEAAQERHETERRAVRDQRRREIQLAKAAPSGDIDWTAVLNAIADAFGTIASRLDALEARVDDGGKSKTRPLNIPDFLAPRTSRNGLRYSQPLETIRS